MKKVLLTIFLLLFLVSAVNGEVRVNSEPNIVYVWENESASFHVTIENTGDFNEKITYVVKDLNWDSERLKYDVIVRDSVDFNLDFKPTSRVGMGKYSIGVRFYSEIDEDSFRDNNFIVDVLNPMEMLEYEFVTNPEGLDAKKNNLVKLIVRNTKNIDLKDLKIKFSGDLFQDEFTMDVDGLGATEKQFRVDIDDNKEATNYNVDIFVEDEERIFLNESFEVKVEEYSDYIERTDVEKSFLRKTIILIEENNGNSRVIKDVYYNFGSFESLFVKSELEPKMVEEGMYTWTVNVKPKETEEIKVVVDYRNPLIIFAIVVIILLLYYHITRRDLVVRKRVLTIKSKEGIAEMKVMIVIRNKGRLVRNVRLVDQIPNVIKAPDQYSTIKPDSIKKSSRGLMLEWKIEELLRREERVISYRIKSNIKVIGKLHVPRALCSYYMGKKKKVVTSNSVMLTS